MDSNEQGGTEFSPLVVVSKILITLIIIEIVITAAMVITYNFFPNFLFWQDTPTYDDIATAGMYFFYISTGMGIVIWIIFYYWFYTAYRNLKVIYSGPLRHSPKMALVCIIVPILNIWETYLNVREIWNYSHPNVLPSGEPIKYIHETNLVKIWWISLLLSVGFLFWYDNITALTISDGLYVLALVNWFLIIKNVTDWQNKKYKTSFSDTT